MSARKLFALLVALAVLLGPAFSRAGEASAAIPSDRSAIHDVGHCQSPPAEKGMDESGQNDSCASMCMGVAIRTAAILAAKLHERAPATFAISSLHLSYLGEIATPPPKFN
jgi:hypothetical protein